MRNNARALAASAKYRKSEKGKISKKKDEQSSTGKARALKYFYSPKGRARYLKRIFGVDYKDWCERNKLLKGLCTICRKPNTTKGQKELCVDHDHETGKFRGLLCARCNKGLGHFSDDIDLLKKAVTYLQTAPSIPIFDEESYK